MPKNINQSLLDGLLERVSIPANLLEAPAPSDEDLKTMINAALTAPDHAGLRPWRFVIIRDHALQRLGDIFREAVKLKQPDSSEAELESARQKALRSPMVITVVATVKDHPKVPQHEQILSAGAAAQNLQLAANALGYGSIWLTGPFAGDEHVCRSLGLASTDRIVGFVYLGTPSPAAAMARKKLQNRPQAADFTVNWTG
ncbi:MAG TPA: nitroreductase [Gammaproteobacteria bacterium]|jgi:nitroreductase